MKSNTATEQETELKTHKIKASSWNRYNPGLSSFGWVISERKVFHLFDSAQSSTCSTCTVGRDWADAVNAPSAFALCLIRSYDSNMDDSRDNKKNRFSNTMVFMEEYLNNVLNDELPFHNEEKNKLTYEVCLQFPVSGDEVGDQVSPCFRNDGRIRCWGSFCLQVVSLARHLIYFGFYSFFELLRLTRTLLGIIDCRPSPGYAGLLINDDGTGMLADP